MSTTSRLLRFSLSSSETICLRCRFRLSQPLLRANNFSTSCTRGESRKTAVRIQNHWRREYFSFNAGLNSIYGTSISSASIPGHDPPISSLTYQGTSTVPSPPTTESTILPPLPSATSRKPHRRRKNLDEQKIPLGPPVFLPPNSSTTLSNVSATLPIKSLRRLLTSCLALSKPRLSFLIVLTTATAYSLYPVPALLPATTTSPSLSALTLLFLSMGTGLCCASANAFNMLLEPKYDAQMSRTRNRPLVRGLIGKRGAVVFATLTAWAGVGGLYFGVNPTVAFLGALNIALYAGVYTPLKRISVLNTWVGALVGGIPPLMGWAAAAGQSATGSGGWQELLLSERSVGGWLLAGLLFAWQFPHFNSLSWPIREEYKAAGYRMLVWTNSAMNGRVALRYAVLCFPICVGLWYTGITNQGFLLTSSVVNGWMVREAWRFWRMEGHKGSARGLFWASVWHLPVVMVLSMVHKKGLCEAIWSRLVGAEEEDEQQELEERQLITVYRKPPRTVEDSI